MRGKYTAKWGVQMTGMNFQTRSKVQVWINLWGKELFPLHYPHPEASL
ncbi:DUF6783 domain-containing protein [uncultured Robinsoniella sp.]